MKAAQSIIKRPLLTEKSARLRETGGGNAAPVEGDSYAQKVVFEVARDANKIEVRAAVQDLFKVTVTHVRTLEYGASSFAFDETNRLVPARVVDVGDDDGGPVARESVGDRASASGAAGAGHDHDLIAAIVHASSLCRRRSCSRLS